MDKTKVTKDLENKTLTLERMFDAPRERVWDAFAQEEQFVKWWGPEGWETTVKEFDFTPGGRIHYCMKCVDKNQGEWFGQESWGIMVIEATDKPNSFTYKDYFSDAEGAISDSMPETVSTNEFHAEADGKTRLVSRSSYGSAEDLAKLLDMGMVEGWSQSQDKLDRVLQ